MNGFLRIIAYFRIGTTPFQIGIVFWGLPVVITQALKAIVSTWLGFWIQRKIN